MNFIKTTSVQDTEIIPKCTDCIFAVEDRIPDPAVEWNDGMRCKPKVDGFRCHAVRPSAAGFPIVKGDDFCALFTERGTNAQPLRHFVSERSDP